MSRSLIHKFGRRINRKGESGFEVIIAVISVIIVLSLLTAAFSGLFDDMSTWRGVTNTNISEASYIIFKDDSGLTCAKNGTSGRIDYRSFNATSVIQSAFDDSNGAMVSIQKGTYEVYNLTLNNKGQKIVGASQSNTYLLQKNGANTNLFELKYAEQFYYISDLCILGDRASNQFGSGIVANYDQIVTIERCYIVDWPEYGISVSNMNQFKVISCSIISNMQGGIWLKSCHQTVIQNCVIELNGNATATTSFGIKVDDYGVPGSSDGTAITSCWFESVPTKFQIDHIIVNASSAGAAIISNCRSNSNFVGNTSVSLRANATGNIIQNNWWSNNGPNSTSVYISPGCKRNILSFNVYSGNPGYMDNGNDTTIMDNYEGQDNYYKLSGIVALSSGEPQAVNSSSRIMLNGHSVIPVMVDGLANITMGANCMNNATYNTVVTIINIRSPTITFQDKLASGLDTNLLLGASNRTIGGYGGSITLMFSQYLGEWVEIGYSPHL